MIDVTDRLSGLGTDDLARLHTVLTQGDPSDPAQVQAHHLVTTEMLSRGLEHGHDGDSWGRSVILMESVTVGSADEIEAPEGFEKAWGSALAKGGTVDVYLTVDGYVLKASPTVSDVHVDTIMDDDDDVEKTILERDGRFVVMNEDGSREFGTYDTREDADERLKQIEQFSKERVRQGAFVSWNSSGGRARGRIERVVREGTINVPDTDFKINAEDDDPAVLIRVYRKGSKGWSATETLVGHKASTLTPISPLTREQFKKASISEGDFVSWGSSGGRARGRVEHVMKEGVLGIPDSSFKINAEEGDPAVLIRIWRRGPKGWRETETLVGHKASTLTTIEPLTKAEGHAIPQAVQSAAKQALEWIREGKAGSGFTSVGRGRARQLADGGSISLDTLVKMRAYFARHAVDKDAEGWGDKSNPTPGMVAWYAWGGDAGRTWANRVLGDVEKSAVVYKYDDPVLLESLSSEDLSEFEKITAILDSEGDPSFYMEKRGNPEPLRDYWREGGRGQIDWGSPGDFTACVDAVSNYMDDEQARGYCAIRHNEVTGMWPGDARNRAMGKAATLHLPGGAQYSFPLKNGSEWLKDRVEKRDVPKSLVDIHINLKNRQHAIDDYMYGPLNPGDPGDYWRRLGAVWGVGEDEALSTRCGNCAAFNVKADMRAAIAENISEGGADVVGAANLGYCELFDFKCAADRSCAAWLTGGPLTDGVEKHLQGKHDQKEHGRRGGAVSVSPEVAASIIERVRQQGGLSVNMIDGSEPPGGYMVARTAGVKPSIAEASDFYDPKRGPEVLSTFLKDNKAQLTGGDYLGLWHDTDSGKVFLDVSQNVKDRATAERLGRQRDQISIWDVVNLQEIDTGGTGEISKAGPNNQVAGHFEDDGRGDRRFRGDPLGKTAEGIVKHLPGRHDQQSHAPLDGAEKLGAALGRAQRRATNLLQRMGVAKKPPRTYTREEANAMHRSYRERYGERSWSMAGVGSDLSPRTRGFGDSPDD